MFWNKVQGALGIIIIIAAGSGWPIIWLPVLWSVNIIIEIALYFTDNKPGKGPERSLVEIIAQLIVGLVGLMVYAFSVDKARILDPAPWWFAITGLPPFLINFGKWIGETFKWLGEALVWCSGES